MIVNVSFKVRHKKKKAFQVQSLILKDTLKYCLQF